MTRAADSACATGRETWAEHRAALDATLFRAGAELVLEPRDGALEIAGADQSGGAAG